MKILVVGLGNLGLFLVRHFVESGFEVVGWDINFDKHKELLKLGGSWWDNFSTDIVLLAVFPQQIKSVISMKQWNPETLFVNVSSVQEPGIESLINVGINQDKVFSFHPLFGPVLISKSGWTGKQIIVTVQHQNDDRTITLLETFTRKGVIVDHMSPEEHDNKMLPHALAFLIAELVKVGAEGADPRFLTGSGRQMLGLLDFTEAGSEELRNLILSNPALKKVVPKLKKVLDKLSERHGWLETIPSEPIPKDGRLQPHSCQ